jgi:hypothetical protein
MAYTPLKTITVQNGRLSESLDLTLPLRSFIGKTAYLVVTQNSFTYALDLGQILNVARRIPYDQPIGTVLNPLFTDRFVTRFKATGIPIKGLGDLYPNRLRVLNPQAFKDYRVHYTSINTPEIQDDPLRRGSLNDLVVTSGQDLSQCLIAVNGVFHKTVYDAPNNRIFVLDGYRTMRLANRHDVVLVDTMNLGGHTIIPLTPANTAMSDWQRKALVTTPISLAGKTTFAVIDGYFYHRDDGVIQYADVNKLYLRTSRMPLIEQFRHNPRTMHQVDRFGTAATQSSQRYNDAYDALFLDQRSCPSSTLQTGAFQYSRLTHFHSFLVVLNNANVFTTTKDLLPSGAPQTYEDPSATPVSGMLRYGCGLHPSYGIWENEAKRKTIFLSEQDYDIDVQDSSISPLFIPSLIPEVNAGTHLPAKMFDYIAA